MNRKWLLLLLALPGCGVSTASLAAKTSIAPEDIRSGYEFLQPDTRFLQDDDFSNPGYLWIDRGERLFLEPSPEGGPACSSCHASQDLTLSGVAARYPAFDAREGKLVNLEGRINICRSNHQALAPLPYESDDLLALAGYVSSLSRGMPIDVVIDGPARAYFDLGQTYFFTRKGQLNLACSQCHNEHWGKKLRGDTISQGHGNAFPAYRLEWQAFGSLQRRLRDCDTGIRAEPLPFGSETYTALELYLASRAQNLTMESPGVRR